MLRNIHLDYLSVCLSVGRSVHKMYCGKTADWIQIPFGVVSRVGRGMGVLDEVFIIKEEGQFCGVKMGRPIVTIVV